MLIWRDPPQRLRPWTDWRQIGDQLRSRPGEWAVVTARPTATDAHAYANKIRLKRLAVGDGVFETRVHGTEVYARYMGDEHANGSEAAA